MNAGRRVLVTGASSGIGMATARRLAADGAAVFATGRDRKALGGLMAEGIETLAGDLTDPAFIARLADAAGPCDVLVANAGRLKHAPFLQADPADWQAVFDLNVMATLRLIQRVAGPMVTAGQGHIVIVSSLLARRVTPDTLVYAASKHAMAAAAAGLRLELGPHGVRVSEVAPGLVATRVQRDIDDPAILARYKALPFDALQPEDIAAAIADLLAMGPACSVDLVEIRPLGQR